MDNLFYFADPYLIVFYSYYHNICHFYTFCGHGIMIEQMGNNLNLKELIN